ncbi:hypothetical protein [Anaeromicrobium sediminis]|uniref:Uncharacterized protein n=1 Tax=Anaeromicrobium sediminis TaxID=1478221 RepID=A0A267MLQ1_9FIRM|nr:hypothetical protein [Anaeromicrobium sediminis]PAB60521.1 hypothetical protein CCE28_02980 [Anaeromicrobium sediminis]
MGSLGKTLFCTYYMLLGALTMIYGILICLDKLRMERQLIIRIICTTSPMMYGIALGLELAIENGNYILLCGAIGILVLFISIVKKSFERSYGVYNLEKKEVFLCVEKVLENMNLEYKVDGGDININNLCHMEIFKEHPYIALKGKDIKDENLFESIIHKIKNEVCKYELPKKVFYKGGYTYIAIGLTITVGFYFMLFFVL